MEINDEKIKEIRASIKMGEYDLSTEIEGMEVWFWGKKVEDVSDEMIVFALDIVNAYKNNKEKYDNRALEEVKTWLNDGEEVADQTILNQIGTPIISVATKLGASLMYDAVEEIGDHMPEVILERDLEVKDVAING